MQTIAIGHQGSDSSVLRNVLPSAVAVGLGAVMLAFQLGSGISLALATIVALLSATVPLLAINNPDSLSTTRIVLRGLGVVQLALLLWISVLLGHALAGGYGAASTLMAVASFIVLLGFDAVLTLLVARVVHGPVGFGSAAALLMSEKYEGQAVI